MTAQQKMTRARMELLLSDPFFGLLALRLQMKEDKGCGSAWTDGVSIGYDPKYVDTLTQEDIKSLVAEEVIHCAALHPWRRDNRELRKWNVACDKAINGILAGAGYKVLADGMIPTRTEAGKSAEWIFDRMGDGDTPQSKGQVRDSPAEQKKDGTEEDWRRAVINAAEQAKGKLPATLERFARGISTPKIDWKSVLRRFVQEFSASDYCWMKPNRNYLSMGLFMPSLFSEEVGPIAFGVDTSGSIDDVALNQAQTELVNVVDEVNPRRVHVYYADAEVAGSDVIERGDPLLWRPSGGGGTDFRPVFDAVAKLEDAPCCLIYITDLCGEFPHEAPEIPTLWITPTDFIAPFGETVKMY